MQIESKEQACALALLGMDYLLESDSFDETDSTILRAARNLCGMQLMH